MVLARAITTDLRARFHSHRPRRPIVFASGILPSPWRVNLSYTRFPRTSRSMDSWPSCAGAIAVQSDLRPPGSEDLFHPGFPSIIGLLLKEPFTDRHLAVPHIDHPTPPVGGVIPRSETSPSVHEPEEHAFQNCLLQDVPGLWVMSYLFSAGKFRAPRIDRLIHCRIPFRTSVVTPKLLWIL